MRFDLGLLLGVLFEFIPTYFLFTTSFPLRKSSSVRNTYALVGYLIILFVAGIGNIIGSITAFLVINLLFLYRCFEVNFANAFLQCTILDIWSVLSEYAVLWLMNINLTLTESVVITPQQSLTLTVTSKILFLLGVFVLKKFITNGKQYLTQSIPIMIILPILSLIFLILITDSKLDYGIFIFSSIFIFIVNITIFSLNDLFCKSKHELDTLRAESEENTPTHKQLELIDRNCREMRMLKHDFKEYINTLEALSKTGTNAVQNVSNELKKLYAEHISDDYTDNEVLNILINEKVRECIKKKIMLCINPFRSSMKFLGDIDAITIFSNLLNNSIEACEDAQKKNIYLSVGNVNTVFTVIKTENTCAVAPPVSDDGTLLTSKEDKQNHGFGVKSIISTVLKYQGKYEWFYDEKSEFFKTIVVVNHNS